MSDTLGRIDIVFDGPPGPQSGRFVEVENHLGRSVRFGEWVERDGFWCLRISGSPALIEAAPALLELARLFESCVVYEINRNEKAGDTEGANLKRVTLRLIRDVIAKAGGAR